MPGWIVSPLFSYNHITAPQTIAAKMEKYLGFGGMGLAISVAVWGPGVARGMNDAITREQMYSTTYYSHARVDTYVSLPGNEDGIALDGPVH